MHPVLEGAAELHLRWRPSGAGALVTVTLVNAVAVNTEKELAWDEMLLQVGLDVEIAGSGEILEYPSARMASSEGEERELRLQYNHARIYAVGHGCAADWTDTGVEPVRDVRTEVMPVQEVRGSARR